MCPAEADRTHLTCCCYLEIVTLREEEKLNGTLFASHSRYENVSSSLLKWSRPWQWLWRSLKVLQS